MPDTATVPEVAQDCRRLEAEALPAREPRPSADCRPKKIAGLRNLTEGRDPGRRVRRAAALESGSISLTGRGCIRLGPAWRDSAYKEETCKDSLLVPSCRLSYPGAPAGFWHKLPLCLTSTPLLLVRSFQ